jgi:hypothetical protein
LRDSLVQTQGVFMKKSSANAVVPKSTESKKVMIDRLLAKAELNFKCCNGSCGHIVTESPKK